jgi:hypothetical protein
MIEIKTAKKP